MNKTYKYNFDGIQTDKEPDNNEFINFYDNLFIVKEPFTVYMGDDDKEVKLHTVIEDIDMYDYEDSTNHIITISVIPDFDSLSEKNKENILSQFSDDDRENMLKDKDSLLYDIYSYGFNVPIREVNTTPEQSGYVIDSAKAVYFGIQGLIGFELDKCKNRLGNTGWDMLDDFCNDVDLIKSALARYK